MAVLKLARRWLTIGHAVALAVSVDPRLVAAQETPPRAGRAGGVRVTAVDDDCFTREALQAAVNARMGANRLRLELRFEWVLFDDQPVLRMIRSNGDATRVPADNLPRRCDVRMDALVEKIKLAAEHEEEKEDEKERGRALDARRPTREQVPSRSLDATNPPVPLPASLPVVVLPPSPARRWPAIAGALQIVVVGGLVSKIGAGGTADLELTVGELFKRARIDLRGAVFVLGREPVVAGPARAAALLAAGRVDGCAGFDRGNLRFRGCLGLLAGAVHFDVAGLPISLSPTVPWLAMPLRADVTWYVTRRLGLRIGVDGIVSLGRVPLVVQEGATTVDHGELPRWGILGGAGPVVIFR